jgi:hypothetical protein
MHEGVRMQVSGWKVWSAVAAATFLASGLAIAKDSGASAPTEGKVVSEVLLQTTRSWDGETYKPYPKGQPQLSVLRICIPPHTSLPWHNHTPPAYSRVNSPWKRKATARNST